MVFEKYTLLLFTLIISASLFAQPVSAPDFAEQITRSPAQLLDVRTAQEYGKGHIANALHADWLERKEFARRTDYLDKQKPVYVYCASGPRSTAAAKYLREQGFSKVIELKGGFNGWKAAGLAFEETAKTTQISMKEYQSYTTGAEIVLIDFGAPWCPPCRKMEPVLQELERSLPSNARLVRIDADAATQVMKELEVEALPTFLIYKNGQLSWKKNGLVSLDELRKAIN